MNVAIEIPESLYSPPRSPVVIDMPPLAYLAVEGACPADWARAVQALRTAAPDGGQPIEVLWADDGVHWTALRAVDRHVRGRGDRLEHPPVEVPGVRLAHLHEGWCVQVMVVSSADEGAQRTAREAALERIAGFVTDHGYQVRGRLHEILLDGRDPAHPEATPTVCRSVLRRPVDLGG